MLPEAQAKPTRLGQAAICVLVTLPVSADLLGPKPGVRCSHRVMLRAPMPEAAVQEDGYLR
jgi:hypothetical protein